MLEAHPAAGGDLLRTIPRLEGVAEIIAGQNQRFDGPALPLGARLLLSATVVVTGMLDLSPTKKRNYVVGQLLGKQPVIRVLTLKAVGAK